MGRTPKAKRPKSEFQAIMDRTREAMEARGLSQAELSRRLEVRETTVSNWFTRNATPSGELLARIPEIIGVSPTWLLTGKGHKLAGVVSGDPIQYAEAVRRGAMLELQRQRDMLNKAEQQWATVTEDQLVAALTGGDGKAPPWQR